MRGDDLKTPTPHTPAPGRTDLLVTALWLGLVVGLIEGVGWLVAQHFGRLTHVWTQVLWIAPVVDALVLLVVGLVLAASAPLVPRKWWWPGSLFGVAAAGAINFVSLAVGQYL